MNLGSVRVRLTLWNIGVLTLLVLTFALAVGWLVRESVYDSVDDQLETFADGMVINWTHFRPNGSQDRPGFARAGDHPFDSGPPFQLQDDRGPNQDRRGPEQDHRGTDQDRRGPDGGGFFRPGPPPDGPPGHHSPFHLGPPPNDHLFLPPRIVDMQGHPLMNHGPNDSRSHGENGKVWDLRSFLHSRVGQRVYSTVTQDGEEVRVFSVPLMYRGQIEAVLQVAYPLGDLRRVIDVLRQVLVAILPLEIVIAGLGGLFLTARALRPVRRIREVADEISAHDLSRRIEVTGRDEISELAATINQMIARLETSFEQQRRFVADVSHELRTPLATIKSGTSLALSHEREREAYREALEVTDRAADRMNRLVEDLLLLARSDAHQMDLEMQAVPIGDVFSYAVELQDTHGKASLEVCPPEESLVVMVDVEYLVRVFVNLLTNALRHTPPDGRIVLNARREENWVVAEVADTGEGIPEEHLPHLGERFYRADRSRGRQRGGTGLGLAISKSIVESLGGAMEIRSRVGQGTAVTVRLPLTSGPVD